MLGQTVSHYRITKEIGAGGMGVVYEAHDTHLDRTVALKLLPPDLTRDETAKKRFITEARAASSLQHHNICTIHDVDETTEGQLFLVMDCYDGETLREKIDRGPLPVDESLDITRQIADGLARAHQAGMVHRDIKPANIMITAEGEVKILDFGLAKLAGKTRVTKTGTTLGTAAYMSPEQTRGEEVDASSDVWSVGVMLYEMLAGQRPFTGEHDLAVAYGIVNNTQAPITTYRGDVPKGVMNVIDRCLAKNPKGRFADAGALREALEYVDDPDTGGDHKRPPLQRIILTALAAAVVVVAVFGWLKWYSGDNVSAQEQALAIIDFADRAATGDDNTALGMTSLVNVGLVEKSPIRVISPTYVHEIRRRMFGEETEHVAESQALEIARACNATQLVWGEVLSLDGTPMVMWHLIDVTNGRSIAARRLEASNLIACADALVEEVVPLVAGQAGVAPLSDVGSASDLMTKSPKALEHYLAGMRAASDFEDARPYFYGAIRADSTFALAYVALSRVYFGDDRRYTDIDSAQYYARRAWSLRARLGVKDRLRLEGRLAESDGRLGDALRTWQELYERWPEDEDLIGRYAKLMQWEVYPESSWAHVACRGWELYPKNKLIGVLCEMGHPTPEGRIARAHELTRRFPGWANSWDELGLRFLEVGQPDSAEVAFRRALDIDAEFYPSLVSRVDCDYYRGLVDSALAGMTAFVGRWATSASDSCKSSSTIGLCPQKTNRHFLSVLPV
jgi:tetratricopeptide (TPR) repeat protein